MNNCLVLDKRLDLFELKPRTLLCVGGTRSGKSDFALNYANQFQGQKAFIATMQRSFVHPQKDIAHYEQTYSQDEIQDNEILARIQKHQKQRDASWFTLEEPYGIISAIELAEKKNAGIILVDCISLWLSNLLCLEEDEENIVKIVETLANTIQKTQTPLVFVSNEVGMGIVPLYKSARLFRDIQGKANQILAEACSAVVTFSCGIPLLIKG